MPEAQEIAVTVEPELPLDTSDVTVKAGGDPAKAKDPVVDDFASQFKELKAEREQAERDKEDEKRRREAAESAARQATAEALRARKEVAEARANVVDSHFDTVMQGLAAAQAEADAAAQEHVAALEAGDFAKATAAQRKIAKAEAKIVRLDEAKENLESAREQKQTQQPIEAAQVQQPSDPVEAYIAGRTEPTARWLREHKDWITDDRKNKKLTAAHHDAMSEGLQPDSQAYFDHVETFIGLKKAADTNGAQPAPRRKTSPPVAPVGSNGGGVSGNGVEVRLSATEARAATDGTHVWNYDDPSGQKRFKKGDPIGVQEFARRKHEMQKQGLYDKVYIEQ